MNIGLATILEQLKSDLALYSDNPIFQLFDLEKCREIDQRALAEPFIKAKYDECLRNLTQAGIDHSKHIETAFNAYNEIVIFDHMASKCEIKGIYDIRQSAPDYIGTSKAGKKVNIDLKTLSYVESIWNIKSIQEQFCNKGLRWKKFITEDQERKPVVLCSVHLVKSTQRNRRHEKK